MMQASPPTSFLIVSLRYFGDVLLSTSLAVSIKTHLPKARVEFLVFKGTEQVLAGNRWVDAVHTVAPGLSGLGTFARLWRRYDVAIGVNASDRTAIFSFAAGRRRIGLSGLAPKEWWKKHLLHECRPYDGEKHMVPLMLSQLEPLGIPPVPRVSMGFGQEDAAFVREELGPEPFVLLHPYTRRPYKYWPAAAWGELARRIRQETNFRAVFSVSGDPADRQQFEAICAAAPESLSSFSRPFTLCQLAAAISRSEAFVGVDTVATHMAAALEVPSVALYGPTRTVNWGPWPNGWEGHRPYEPGGGVQRRGKVMLVQLDWSCIPCGMETCAISERGKMECLEKLEPEVILAELKRRLSAHGENAGGNAGRTIVTNAPFTE